MEDYKDNCRSYTQSLPSPQPPLATSPPASPSPPGIHMEPVDDLRGDLREELAGGGGAPSPPSSPPPSDASLILEELAQPPQEEPRAAMAAILTDELREKIVRQVEYYFSDENLPMDNFLLKHVKKNKGFVPISLIASFRKMKKLVQDNSLIESALRTSSKLFVSSDGKKIKRRNPLLDNDREEAKLRTVLVKNLPGNCLEDYIQKRFGSVGNIKRISIQGHPQKADGAKINRERTFVSNKLHAYVEYETAEAAMKAVTSLNDESNWRTGLRVEPLAKQGKHGQALKGQKGIFSGNHDAKEAPNTIVEESDMKPSDQPNERVEQEEKHASQEKNELKIQSRHHGRARQQYYVEGHGLGIVPSGPRIEGLNRPDLVPRMPDGTRGFTVGRGKPIIQKDG